LVEPVGDELTAREGGTLFDAPAEKEQQDEDAVDERDGGAEEVIVVAGDELAQLVDERAEADASHYRRDPLDTTTEERQERDEAGEHEEPTPEHVGDVEPVPAQLREAGEREEEADRQDRDDRPNEHSLQEHAELGVTSERCSMLLAPHVSVHGRSPPGRHGGAALPYARLADAIGRRWSWSRHARPTVVRGSPSASATAGLSLGREVRTSRSNVPVEANAGGADTTHLWP
jgi:hypothetical protein